MTTSTIVSDKTVKQVKLLKTPLELLGRISYKFCIRWRKREQSREPIASTFHIGSFTSSVDSGASTFLSSPLKMGKHGKVKRDSMGKHGKVKREAQ